jgi:hypothetical protein
MIGLVWGARVSLPDENGLCYLGFRVWAKELFKGLFPWSKELNSVDPLLFCLCWIVCERDSVGLTVF